MMKNILIAVVAVALLAGCMKEKPYDAEGFFEAEEVMVSAENSGRLLQFNVHEGDTLRMNATVGQIDTLQLSLKVRQLRKQRGSVSSTKPDISAQAASLRAQIAQANTEKHRVEGLYADGAATGKQLDDAKALVNTLNGQLNALLSTLDNNTVSISDNASSIELQVAQIEDQIAKCRVYSPIDGIVLAKYTNPGEMAVSGKPLFKISDLSHVWLRAYVTSEQIGKIKLGQAAKVYADFGGGEVKEYPGHVTWIASESEFTPKSVQTDDSRANLVYAVKIAVKNDGRLKLGFYGGVRF